MNYRSAYAYVRIGHAAGKVYLRPARRVRGQEERERANGNKEEQMEDGKEGKRNDRVSSRLQVGRRG